MACLGAGQGEDHPPRQVGRLTPELAIDKVADPSGTQPQRGQRRYKIQHREIGLAVLATKPPHGQYHPEQPAMKRHAPFLDAEQHQRVIHE